MTNRISYIDSAKGIGIMLIVMGHLDIAELYTYSSSVKVPLFFILSGFFLNTNICVKDFIKKKIKGLIIPFVLFWIISYGIFYLIKLYMPSIPTSGATGIFDCFRQHNYFNGPLWFLLCLFWSQIIVLLLEKAIKSDLMVLSISMIIGYIGYTIGNNKLYLPLDVDIALVSVPFLVLGKNLKRINFFDTSNAYQSLLLSFLLYIVCIGENIQVLMSTNTYNCEYSQLLFTISILSISLIFTCKFISEKIVIIDKFLSFVGRCSLWIMCTHHIIYRPIKYIINTFGDSEMLTIVIFIITMIICLITAPIVEKYTPFLIGKK